MRDEKTLPLIHHIHFHQVFDGFPLRYKIPIDTALVISLAINYAKNSYEKFQHFGCNCGQQINNDDHGGRLYYNGNQ